MQEIIVSLPSEPDFRAIEQHIDEICLAEGLACRLKSSLKKYPGSLHWHFKREGQAGVLEITLWPQARRLWFILREGRRAAWVDEIIPSLQRKLEEMVGEP
jgi:hypothetical protein